MTAWLRSLSLRAKSINLPAWRELWDHPPQSPPKSSPSLGVEHSGPEDPVLSTFFHHFLSSAWQLRRSQQTPASSSYFCRSWLSESLSYRSYELLLSTLIFP